MFGGWLVIYVIENGRMNVYSSRDGGDCFVYSIWFCLNAIKCMLRLMNKFYLCD